MSSIFDSEKQLPNTVKLIDQYANGSRSKDSLETESVAAINADLDGLNRVITRKTWARVQGRVLVISAVVFAEPALLYLDGSVKNDGRQKLDGLLRI